MLEIHLRGPLNISRRKILDKYYRTQYNLKFILILEQLIEYI